MDTALSGQIVRGVGGFYDVRLDAGEVVTAKPLGHFRHEHITPTVGDKVDIRQAAVDDIHNAVHTITAVHPRKNSFVRPPVANVDVAIVTAALRNPKPNTLLIDKMLVACEVRAVRPILCFTKADLAKPEDRAVLDIYEKTPYPIVISDAAHFDQAAEKLSAAIGKGSAFFAGPSGVGKSTLTNALVGREAMATGGLSEKLGRGRHTTRHVELIALPSGGRLFDTPGFSSLRLDDRVDAAMLSDAFIEFPKGACKFADCRHVKEPGCAVRAKTCAGEIAQSRYDHYCALLKDIEMRRKF